ncbi:50S ribosomal protein L10 [Xiamenia xianingshaonis]|uniref:Large ribosomal subunit protein uL10 n=1 Tax=Xiamenia xianingshaonis TaxID=2682776 RepID=A0ABX0IJ57_9ACTN|nr:50S ribosomal protein L10 [Xiamenia xianingshaonis]NGM18201.1 50S ribosomal protein L10 [Eggerthellaceae bacterium zg-893]NHM13485.1 50S ribosomal protein L10 [Xiamenia xianingshaonis]NHM16654.1 50S ribosomal protein L10 [Xiamenia xianingshaonis]
MPNAQNVESLAQIKAALEGETALWVVDYRGLTVKEIQALRRGIREAGASMKVCKNTLMRIALADMELPTLDDLLSGPSAFVFAGEDVAASAKVLKNFAKDNQNLEIKGGLMEGKAVTAEEVEAIASLPSREELIAMVAGAISGVARGLATTINGVPRGLAQVVKAVADQKGEAA